MKVAYPFRPRSTSYLLPGQFWGIPLKNGTFACGRVVQLKIENGIKDKRIFLAGLMDWHDRNFPTENALAGCRLLAQGEAHIKMIQENGKEILGFRAPEKDNLTPQYFISARYRWGCYLLKGFDRVRVATPEEEAKYPRFSTWGFGVIKILAEKYFGT